LRREKADDDLMASLLMRKIKDKGKMQGKTKFLENVGVIA